MNIGGRFSNLLIKVRNKLILHFEGIKVENWNKKLNNFLGD